MESTNLREEILRVVREEINKLLESGKLKDERKKEIEDFLATRFDKDYPENMIEFRLNEMMDRFEELYIPLASINIKKSK